MKIKPVLKEYYPILIFFGFMLLEAIFPLRKRTRRRRQRYPVNALLIAATNIGGRIEEHLAQKASPHLIAWTSGIRRRIKIPAFLSPIMKLLVMDLAYYYWHRLNHRVSYFKRFHAVHHIDPDLDITTASRFHVVEMLNSALFRTTQLTLANPSKKLQSLFDTIFKISVMFHHSNLRLPRRLERILNFFIVTPRMHGIHHSVKPKEMDTNYSSILTIWDRLFGTLKLNVPQKKVRIGLVCFTKKKYTSPLNALMVPFRSKRGDCREGW